ncbi:MAG: DUF748 domain-containing protein [Deltaproteobacteria bacterium]|nr:MAG: DUF748 domain-containing protein [Deltaproteobacteria bacterium]
MPVFSSDAWLSRVKQVAMVAAVVISLYAILGFFVYPLILKPILLSRISKQSGRTATIDKIRVTPFVLSATIRGFEMNEPDGKRFLGFEELYLNFQISSLFTHTYTFAEIRLLAPDGQAQVLPDGSLNLPDLRFLFNRSEPKSERNKDLPAVIIKRLEIHEGRLAFSDLSLPTPFKLNFAAIGLTLTEMTTRPDSKSPYTFTATMEEGGVLRGEGVISINPFRTQGNLALTDVKTRTLWKYFQHLVQFEFIDGSVDLAGHYVVDAAGEGIHAELFDGKVKLSGFKLGEKGSNKELISVPTFSIQNAGIDFSSREVVVESVSSSDAQIEVWLEPDGKFNYERLFVLESPNGKGGALFKAADQAETESNPWRFVVREVNLRNYGVEFENRTLAAPLRVRFGSMDVKLKNVSSERGSEAEVTVGLKVNETGTLEIKGKGSGNPVSADLTLKLTRLGLQSLQPTWETFTQLWVVKGTASLVGRLQYRSEGSPAFRFRGHASIDGFEADDSLRSEDLLQWESIAVNDAVFQIAPNKLAISQVVAKQPYARVIIWPNGTVKVIKAFSPEDEEDREQAVFILGKLFKFKIVGPLPIAIDEVRIENGSAVFADSFIKPNFSARMQSLNGSVKGLYSEPLARAEVVLAGKVNEYAPVTVEGQINPLSRERYADLALSFRNLELTSLTPYSGRFVGYSIKRGKLSLDARYKYSKNLLVGENSIVLNKLTLGDRVESPSATQLPVRLAIAILTDPDGSITLDVPVRGNVDDPDFGFGGVVAKALGQAVGKIVTAPVAALGSLIGGRGKELSYVEFDYGSAELEDEQIKKLDQLAEVLRKRPALELEIEGVADRMRDRLALAEAALVEQLKQAKLEEQRSSGAEIAARDQDLALSDDDYVRLIKQVYVTRFGEEPKRLFAIESETSSRKSPQSDPPILMTDVKQRLLEDIQVDERDLRQLARERAAQIEDYLAQQAEISDERLYELPIKVVDATDEDTIRVQLTLSAK